MAVTRFVNGDKAPVIRQKLNAIVDDYNAHIADDNPHGTQLGDLDGTTLTTPTNGQMLLLVGGIWVNRAMVESAVAGNLVKQKADGTIEDAGVAATYLGSHGDTHTDGTDDVADFTADTGVVVGIHGLVPASAIGDAAAMKVLTADGAWTAPDDIIQQAKTDRFDPFWPFSTWWDPYEDGDPTGYGWGASTQLRELEVLSEEGGDRHYYRLSTDDADPVIVQGSWKWRVPERFASWDTSNAVGVTLWTTDVSGDSYATLRLYNASTLLATKTEEAPGATWTTTWFTAAELSTTVAGDILTLEIDLVTSGELVVQAAEILLGYTG